MCNGNKKTLLPGWRPFNGDEQFQSQLISDVVQKNPIKNVRINEVSTEEIVRKIYEEGMTLS